MHHRLLKRVIVEMGTKFIKLWTWSN